MKDRSSANLVNKHSKSGNLDSYRTLNHRRYSNTHMTFDWREKNVYLIIWKIEVYKKHENWSCKFDLLRLKIQSLETWLKNWKNQFERKNCVLNSSKWSHRSESSCQIRVKIAIFCRYFFSHGQFHCSKKDMAKSYKWKTFFDR